MPTYVAFLRAINLGAKRKFPKADIVAATEAAGGTDVATHINTGNVRLSIPLRSRAKVEAALEAAYLQHTGFEVPTVVYTPAELRAIAAHARELSEARPTLERHYIYLLKSAPTPERVEAVVGASDEVNEVVVRDRAAHVLLGAGYVAGNVDPYRVERSLGVVATNRNLNVVSTLAEKWC
ncbi:DUF1697 domain-containing protein [Nocardioides sp. zg-536]|uniref:DUF1697 domain-containing protein n=1 Tax=Nocardioides faecalis TaxID=2803858 RepID=A0A938Y9X5_9ACTN|nr:DUF1697 domain-containing protein [Nocardioides faecalis]MBM9460808.1 DUF1697 domain-containing protein [Nocardioides faecalis]QVI57997.1 DUF1697 domain-containing protein [Nocardioides faecalis]